MTTIEILRDFIVREMHWDGRPDELRPDFALVENHVIDSMGLFKLVSFVEERFGVLVRDEELTPTNFGTLDAIVGLIERKQTGS